MFFKAIFSHWIDDEEPAVGHVSVEYRERKDAFYLEAENIQEATMLAKKYEGIETHAHEGIGALENIMKITHQETTALTSISTYNQFLPEVIRERKRKFFEAHEKARDLGLIGSEAIIFIDDQISKK